MGVQLGGPGLSAYRPPQRSITARIFTASRWIRGTFHLPKLHSFLEYLCREAAFYRLTGVTLEEGGPEAPFFALRRSFATIIAPQCLEEALKLEMLPGAMPHPVDCLLESGMVSGLLSLLPNVRVSDHLMHQEGFVALRGATFPPGPLCPPGPVDVLFVNARALVGVRERNPSVPAAERVPAPKAIPAGAEGGEAAAPARREAPPERKRAAEGEPPVEEWVIASRRG